MPATTATCARWVPKGHLLELRKREGQMATPESDGFVRSFARGLSVIEAMGSGTGSHTVASVAVATQLPRTVARRILMTLTEVGYTVSDGKHFRLTPKILNLGMTYLTSLPFWGMAQEVLEQFCAVVKESAALSVFDGHDVIYIMRVPSRKVMSLRLGLGSRLPAYNTSPGRVLLASQDEAALEQYLNAVEMTRYTRKTITTPAELREALTLVRDQGFAWVNGEFDSTVCGLSVPVHDDQNQIVASLNVNLLSSETTEAKAVRKLLIPLQESAERLRAIAPDFLRSVATSADPRRAQQAGPPAQRRYAGAEPLSPNSQRA
ncbi:MAG: IclR family transcriptional regulator C-terminal domain-containing protein [Burkholderiales bacterium]